MISARLAGGTNVQDRLTIMTDAATLAIARAIAKLGIDLRNNVQQNKLSGQVLKVRSGFLKQGITTRTEQTGAAITTTVYTDASYAAAQEYGFTGTVNVRASLRRIKAAFGHPVAAATIDVGAYSRRMDLPQRSFLRSTLDDMAMDINEGIAYVLYEAVR